MRVFCSTLLHECNSFSPLPTTMEDFRQLVPLDQREREDEREYADRHDLVLRTICKSAGHDVVDGIHLDATPSAPISKKTYHAIRELLIERLRDAGSIDMVLLFLHGAQMAEGYDDCEGDVISRVRAIVGPEVPIGVLLDLHCNISSAMTDNADLIVACREYPHVDFHESGILLESLTARAVSKRLRPTIAFAPVPMLGFFHTTREPMRGFVERTRSLEGQRGILSISLTHGCPVSDWANNHAGVLVVSDGDEEQAYTVAAELAREFFRMRVEIAAPSFPVQVALDRAESGSSFPAVVADVADNPGGGSPGDSTHLLAALIDRGTERAAIASIWDPIAFEHICRAGSGGRIPLRLGGKVSQLSGAPVDCTATVLSIRDDISQVTFGALENIGPTAAISIDGIDVIVARERFQVTSPDVFTGHGIDVGSKRLLVVKSAHHFIHEFSKISENIVHASAPGFIGNDFTLYPYRHVPRPVWPLDETPFTRDGAEWI